MKCGQEVDSDISRYVLDFVLENAGFLDEEDGDTPDIFYGNSNAPNGCKLSIKRNPSDTIWRELLSGVVGASDFSGNIPFDLVSAMAFFLLDKANQDLGPDSFDVHGRLIHEKSYQKKNGLEEIPIVNMYASFLKSMISESIGRTGPQLWPEGKKCAIGLSHDMDRPVKYAELFAPLIARNCGVKRNIWNNYIRAKALIERLGDHNPDGFWTIDEVMESEQKRGFSSTFFFASINRYTKWGMDLDVGYNLRHRRFEDLFREMNSSGFEIGLHASYTAFEDAGRLAFERERLQEIAGTSVKGVRHHYWHIDPTVERTWEFQEKAGLEYDSTLGFNDHMGFRRNIALPFYPWSNNRRGRINVLQIPAFCMDGNLFYKPIEVDDAIKRVIEYIKIIKRFGGVGAIDWHGESSSPANIELKDWGEAYRGILDYLASDREIWVTNLGEINDWYRKRKRIA